MDISSRRIAVGLIAALAVAAAIARADTGPSQLPDGRLVLAVPVGDLRLDTDAGVQAMYRRLWRAARRVCPGTDARDLAVAALQRECAARAMTDAVAQVGHPALAALHARRSGARARGIDGMAVGQR